jgi:hypothetical protein
MNISSYVNLGNVDDWFEFLEWYKVKYGDCEVFESQNNDRVNVVNSQKEVIAHQNSFHNGERGYYADAQLYSLMIKENKR